MLDEGAIINSTSSLVKSEMLRQIWELKRTIPQEWERRVFERIMQFKREDIDFAVEDNQAGYYMWIRAFDRLVQELIDDGYIKEENTQEGLQLVAADL
jgi:hypothetical protein